MTLIRGEGEVVAFLGPQASYCHQAATSRFAEPRFALSPQHSIAAVFSAVQSGAAVYGVVPFENSSNGSVLFTLDLFATASTQYPDLLVSGEIYIPVRHCLLGRAPAPTTTAAPTAGDAPLTPPDSLRHITTLYSHPQAWGQCKRFLAMSFPGTERRDVSSTSRAAELVAADPHSSAAISSPLAAQTYGLDVLAASIEDVRGNSTRFLVLTRGASTAAVVAPASSASAEFKTLVSLTVEHGAPGALADCLAVFKRHALNLTSINSRPSGEVPWHYIFFLECWGRRGAEGEGSAVDEALVELGRVARDWRWLGSWESAQ